MKNVKLYCWILMLSVAGFNYSCSEWLDVGSDNEVFEKDAFATARGFRSALIGIYKQAASENLWGKELSWGFMSVIAYTYGDGSGQPVLPTKYTRQFTSKDYTHEETRQIISGIWETAYTAIANCNNLIQSLEKSDAEFEYPWEKDMIMAEARGMRALLHFQMLQLFCPAPVTGETGSIPYVTKYPDLLPEHKPVRDVLGLIIEDLEYARNTLEPIDVEELRNKSTNGSGGTLVGMDEFLFQGLGNIHADGAERLGTGSGFFAFRGYRFNYWGATGLLARVYSYMRDFDNAEKYADAIINDWVDVPNQFYLYNANPPAAGDVTLIDGKRRPEPLIAFWDDQARDNYMSALTNSSMFRTAELKYLFEGDESADYRFVGLYDSSSKRYRVWNGPDASSASNSPVVKYSNPLLPVLELSEIFFIKAECLAHADRIEDARAVLKRVRDARGCIEPLTESDEDSFMNRLVNEAVRDFLTRGMTWLYLKKLNWPTLYNGKAKWGEVPEGWYLLPMPDSEIAYY